MVEIDSPHTIPGNDIASWHGREVGYDPKCGEGSLAKDLGFIAYEVTRLCGAALFGMMKAC